MQIHIKPNPENAGKYFCYVTDCESVEELLALLEQRSNILTHVFVHFLNEPIEGHFLAVKNQYANLGVYFMAQDEIEAIKSREIIIPKWVMSDTNFSKIVIGDYGAIRPITAEFVTTLNCNFRCNQCSYAEPKQSIGIWKDTKTNKPQFVFNDETHMSEETMIISIDKLVEGGVNNILFTGGGEPFFNAEITLKGMRYAKSKGLTIGLYSNGSLLNEKIVKEIFSISPLFVRISVYGSTCTTFSKYTNQKNNVFYKVVENIKLLAQEKKRMKSDTQLGLSYLVHPETMPEMILFPETLQENFSIDELEAIDFIRFTPAVEYFGERQHPQEMMEGIFSHIETNIKPILSAFGIDVKIYYHRLADLNQPKLYTFCRASGWYVEVGPNGDVYLCCEKLFVSNYKIGNLLEQSLNDVFIGRKRSEVVDYVNNTNCKNCPTLCKPHELNKIFDELEKLRKDGCHLQLEAWRNDLLHSGKKAKYAPGKLNDFES